MRGGLRDLSLTGRDTGEEVTVTPKTEKNKNSELWRRALLSRTLHSMAAPQPRPAQNPLVCHGHTRPIVALEFR